MKKIIYTRPDGGVSIICPAPKEKLESVLGPLTNKQYRDHVMSRSLPKNAKNVRLVKDSDIPSDREFRDAWVDISKDSRIDIDLTRAKEIALKELRRRRNAMLEITDKDMVRAIEENISEDIKKLKRKRKALRDATESLKGLDTDGKANDLALLSRIKAERDKYGS